MNCAFILFTNNPKLAREADRAGIEYIGPDLERLGKSSRQGHLTTWISDHKEEDLAKLAPCLRRAQLFARCNPWHDGLDREIDRLVAQGVTTIMLPYFHRVEEAARFIEAVAGRARTLLLIETAAAAAQTAALCRLPGVDGIHFGLNDLRLSLGWPSHFHVLTSPELEQWCEIVNAAGIPCGIGGIGRAGDRDLPIAADLVYAQLARLGASATLISRVFFHNWAHDLRMEISRARLRLREYQAMGRAELENCRQKLRAQLVAQGERVGSG